MGYYTSLSVGLFGVVILSLLLIVYYNDSILEKDYTVIFFSLMPLILTTYMINQLEHKCTCLKKV